MVNSSSDALTIDGLDGAAACDAVVSWLEAQSLGTRKVNYKLRDWLFARQVGSTLPCAHCVAMIVV